MKKKLPIILSLLLVSSPLMAEEKKNIKYRKSGKIDFESLLIQGEKKRAEILVVTGDASDDLDGLLRLRENFHDHQTLDFGEEIK